MNDHLFPSSFFTTMSHIFASPASLIERSTNLFLSRLITRVLDKTSSLDITISEFNSIINWLWFSPVLMLQKYRKIRHVTLIACNGTLDWKEYQIRYYNYWNYTYEWFNINGELNSNLRVEGCWEKSLSLSQKSQNLTLKFAMYITIWIGTNRNTRYHNYLI